MLIRFITVIVVGLLTFYFPYYIGNFASKFSLLLKGNPPFFNWIAGWIIILTSTGVVSILIKVVLYIFKGDL